MLGCVLEHQLVRILPCLFTELGVERDVAADQRLQRRAKRPDDAAGADDDASDQTDVTNDATAWKVEGGRDEFGIDSAHGADGNRGIATRREGARDRERSRGCRACL